uniref:B30.2/SPRY domain-containing protein n=1 Tax=Anser brachyrhynchus TaxID=132585 RepID=A0A8B9BNG7_9AVES
GSPVATCRLSFTFSFWCCSAPLYRNCGLPDYLCLTYLEGAWSKNFLRPIRVEIKAWKGNNKCKRSTIRKFQSSNLVALYYLTNDLLIAVDVTLDADTAHPRLRVSEDGKSVTDTGEIRRVPSKKERFDSHTFVLAKEAYASGRLYWEVDVGKRRNWILGVAQETVKRKGTVVLSPQNGFWAIGLADGRDYWAYTDPWTHLTVTGRPRKIGIFLDILAKKLSFYNVHQKNALYTFSFISTAEGVSASPWWRSIGPGVNPGGLWHFK